jgi:regulator of protease activity HflC (stomatin/prohibitin superfamily)
MIAVPIGIAAVVLLLALVLASSLRILREYQSGVVFQLGHFWRVKGPGQVILIPGIQQMVRIDLRIVVVDVPSQDVISRDNVTLSQRRAVLSRRRSERAVIGSRKSSPLPANSRRRRCARCSESTHPRRDAVGTRTAESTAEDLDSQTAAWGIKVTNVEIKHVDLNESMIRAIARQAEAERERRAKVIHAEGELQASEKLAQAAEILARQPQAIQLRYLETLTVIAADKNSTIVFPLPMDIVAPLLEAARRIAPTAA